jgi:hypothetical protein
MQGKDAYLKIDGKKIEPGPSYHTGHNGFLIEDGVEESEYFPASEAISSCKNCGHHYDKHIDVESQEEGRHFYCPVPPLLN